MNKSILGFIGLLLVCVVSISFSGKTGGEVGKFIPEIIIQQGDSVEGNIKGIKNDDNGYTLLNFWKTTDAVSRLNGKLYQMWMSGNVEEDFDNPTYIAINLDEKESYRDIISRTDKLDQRFQYVTDTDISTVRKKFGMKNELKSFLIDGHGEIIMINPSPEHLTEFFKQTNKTEEKF